MSEFIDLLISPTTFGLLLLAATVVVWRREHTPSSGRAWVALPLVLYTLVTVPAVSMVAGRGLTWRYETLVPAERRAHVIVLLGGGQVNFSARDEQLAVLTPSSARRVLEAVRLYRLLDDPWVISSGGSQQPRRIQQPNSATMKTTLVNLGVPVDRVLLESTSTTTREQALLIAPMLRRLDAEHAFVLVTSRIHMPRAAAAFRAVGLDPLTAIAPDFVGGDRWSDYFVPDVKGFDFSRAVLHELAGLLYYRWRGWAR